MKRRDPNVRRLQRVAGLARRTESILAELPVKELEVFNAHGTAIDGWWSFRPHSWLESLARAADNAAEELER
jgi:hypothetical protein